MDAVSVIFLLKLFGQTQWSEYFLFGVPGVFFIEMFFVAGKRNNSML